MLRFELGGRQVAERGVQPFLVIDLFEDSTIVGVAEMAQEESWAIPAELQERPMHVARETLDASGAEQAPEESTAISASPLSLCHGEQEEGPNS